MCNCQNSSNSSNNYSIPSVNTNSIRRELLNSPTDGNTVYSSLKNSNSYRDVYDLNGSDTLAISDTFAMNNTPSSQESLFNYVEVLKNGTVTPDQIGKIHNLGLDFVMNYPDFKKYDTVSQMQILGSMFRNIGVIDHELPYSEIYEQFKQYLPLNSTSFLQKAYSNGVINSIQLRYLNIAFGIVDSNCVSSNLSNPVNVGGIKAQINNLISVIKNDKNLSNKQSFSLTTSLSVLKYSAAYWNNYLITKANANVSSEFGNDHGHQKIGYAHNPALPCCVPSDPSIWPCAYCPPPPDPVSPSCAGCLNKYMQDIIKADGVLILTLLAIGAAGSILTFIAAILCGIIGSVITLFYYEDKYCYQECG